MQINKITKALIIVEAAGGFFLPVFNAFFMILGVLAAISSGPILLGILWFLWLVAGWAGLAGVARLLTIILGDKNNYNPRTTIVLLLFGLFAWGYFSYTTFFGAKDYYAYLPLITFPITLHFMFLARNHLLLAFNKANQL